MNSLWVIKLRLTNVQRAGLLRTDVLIDAAVQDELLWLRGPGLEEARVRQLAPLADGPVCSCDDTGRLTPWGSKVPTERLPQLQWQKLSTLLKPELPVSRIMYCRLPRTPLLLKRSASEQPVALLTTDWNVFAAWALSAAEIRLHACRFAVLSDQQECITEYSPGNEPASSGETPHRDWPRRVIVRGHPLPPIYGERYWQDGQLAVPLGFCWSPPVDAAIVAAVLSRSLAQRVESPGIATAPGPVDERGIWIWHADGSADRIPASEFLLVTRSSVRATMAEAAAGDGAATDGGNG